MDRGSVSKTVIDEKLGDLIRKSSGGERAWFLEEGSEPRNKRIFLDGENPWADESVYRAVFEIITEIEMRTSFQL